MRGCDAYQIDCEKRLHGALGPEEAVDLGEHLETCAACRHFDQTARRLEMMMQANAERVADTVDWEQLRDRVERLKSDARRALPRVAAGVGLVIVLNVWANGLGDDLVPLFASAAFVVALVGAVIMFYTRTLLREAARAEASSEALFTFYRKELDQRVSAIRMLGVMLSVAGLYWLTPILGGDFSPGGLLDSAMGLALVGLGLYSQLVSLPRARRERAELT